MSYNQPDGALAVTSTAGAGVVAKLDTDSNTARLTVQTLAAAPLPLNFVTGALQFGGVSGVLGQVLTSNGAGAAPSWQNAGAGGSVDLNLDTTAAAVGEAVIISANSTTAKGSATAYATAFVVGFVSVVGALGVGRVQNTGLIQNVKFVSGLTLSAGDRVFLSLTSGKVTNSVTGLNSPNALAELGVVADTANYLVDNTASIVFLPKTPIEL